MSRSKGRRSRSYCFTLNNPTSEEKTLLKKKADENAFRYIVVGEEISETGTPHLQGYVYFKSAKTLSSAKKALGRRYHIEAARGSPQQASDYCKKDNQFWEIGDLPIGGVGKKVTLAERIERNKLLKTLSLNQLVDEGHISINKVRELKNARLDLAQEGKAYQAEECRGVWYYGEPGVGKSYKARMENPGLYIKAQNKWWDGYQGEEVVLLDDLDTSMLGHYLKIWLDRWSCSGEVKGGTVNLRYKKFIVTSNYTPEELFTDPMMAKAIRRRIEFHEILHWEETPSPPFTPLPPLPPLLTRMPAFRPYTGASDLK